MIPATVKKVFADLWNNKARSLLVALSIAVGVFAVGMVNSSFAVIQRDMAADYNATNPHTARIYCQDFDTALLEALRNIPEVEAIEARYNLWVKIIGPDGKQYPINLNSIEPIDTLGVDQLAFEEGSRTLKKGEIYLERQGAAGLGLKIGDSVSLALNDGRTHSLKLAGTVHDVQANPFKFSSSTSGYVTPVTMLTLGGSDLYNFVTFVTSGSHTDAAQVRQVAERVADQITASGYAVYNINATRPGQHPAQSIIDTVLALLGALSLLAVFLSAFLVTNTVSALMGQQIRQIGVMKAVGATMPQIVGLYLGLALAFGVLALLIAMPLAGLAAYGLARWLVGMLNATPLPFFISPASLALQLFIGLAVPVFGALFPVIGGARCTIRQAMTSYGLDSAAKPGWFDQFLESLPRLPRPLLLSLRNTFRRKARLALTLSTLILGGAIFIAVSNVRAALYQELNQTFGYFQADVNVELTRPYPVKELQSAIVGLPGVAAIESWNVVTANVLHADGDSSDQVVMNAPPVDTRLLEPVMIAGRWLQPQDGNAIVVSNQFTDLRPDVKVGDVIQVRLDEKDTPFQVIGVFRIAGNFPSPFTFVNPEALVKILGSPQRANRIKIATDAPTLARQDEVMATVQTRLAGMGIEATLQTGGQIIAQQRSQVDILINLLLVMGVLIAAVGGLGLMGTMGMNILERTREIGVLRSIGAENGQIFQLVVAEGLLIGGISWLGSGLAAIPITQLLDDVLGRRLMTVPLLYVFSARGLLAWLVIALVLATLASLLPARNAVRLTVRDVLAYE